MEFVYLDEQYSTVNSSPYAAAVGFIISDDRLDELRQRIYCDLGKLLEKRQNVISPIPPLHGKCFLSEYDDETKFKALRILLEAVAGCNGSGFRVGYFDESDLVKHDTPAKRASRALGAGVQLWLGAAMTKRYLLVSEFDLEALKNGLLTMDTSIDQYYQIEKENLSIKLENFMGHVFAHKKHLGCELADILGYLCLKADNPKTKFAKELAALRVEYGALFVMDRIIWWNDREKSFVRV